MNIFNKILNFLNTGRNLIESEKEHEKQQLAALNLKTIEDLGDARY